MKTFYKLTIFLLGVIYFSIPHAHSGWTVDCNNYCAFSEFPNTCQGVYYVYPDGFKSFSTYSAKYGGCMEKRWEVADPSLWGTHVLNYSGISCSCPANNVTLPSETAPMTTETRTKLELLREQIRLRIDSAPNPNRYRSDPFLQFTHDEVKTYTELQNASYKGSYYVKMRCEYGQWQGHAECNYNGDMMGNVFWLCQNGVQERCNDIADSQDPVTGAWYRNGYQRRHPEASSGTPLLSRDHTLGIMGYLAKSGDKTRALKWLNFIKNNPKVDGFFSICPQRPNIPKPSQYTQVEWDKVLPDDRCRGLPDILSLYYRTFKYIGITDAEMEAIDSDIYNDMLFGLITDETSMNYNSGLVPNKGVSSFQIALFADNLMVRHAIGNNSSDLASTANKVNNRTEKINPRFHYIAQNYSATEYGAYLIQKYCRVPRPWYGNWASTGNLGQNPWPGNPTNQFYIGENIDTTMYQYFGSTDPWGAKFFDIGHECLGWINLYLGNNSRRSLICQSGETIVDGACQTVAFTKATLSQVAGLGYEPMPPSGNIRYEMNNHKDCPFGGTPVINDPSWTNPYHQNYCLITNAFPASIYKPGKTYWIDNSAFSQGVYTSLNSNNGCDSGETLVNNSCRAYAFPTLDTTLYVGVNYWVDSGATNPGVYYAKDSGACPYGGIPIGSNCRIYAAASGLFKSNVSYFIRRNAKFPGIYHYPSLGKTYIESNTNTIQKTSKPSTQPTQINQIIQSK